MSALSFETKTRTRHVEPETIDLDGEAYTVIRPKDAVLFELAQLAEVSEDELPAAAKKLAQYLDSIFEPESRRRLSARLHDPHDGFDLIDLVEIGAKLIEHWQSQDANRETRRAAKKSAKKA